MRLLHGAEIMAVEDKPDAVSAWTSGSGVRKTIHVSAEGP